jgi:hypothetical protein
MPEICRFYGGCEALIRLHDLAVVRGALPPKALALTREWAVANREVLLHNWDRVQAGMAPVPVPPLE